MEYKTTERIKKIMATTFASNYSLKSKMKEKVKKIIAKEFLYSLSCIILFFGIFMMWYYLNSNNKSKIETLNKEIELLNTKYRKPNNEYLSGLFNYLGATDSLKINEDNWVRKIKNSEIEKKKIFKILGGEEVLKGSYTEWNLKVFGNKNNNEILIINKKIEELKKSIFNNELYPFDLFIILLSVIFGIRYLIYSTIWSVKKLKE